MIAKSKIKIYDMSVKEIIVILQRLHASGFKAHLESFGGSTWIIIF